MPTTHGLIEATFLTRGVGRRKELREWQPAATPRALAAMRYHPPAQDPADLHETHPDSMIVDGLDCEHYIISIVNIPQRIFGG